MRYVVCSVFDVATSAFGRPVCVAAVGQMVRSFSDEVNRDAADNSMFHHPADFQLFHLGFFDDADGHFDLLGQPVRVALGVDVSLKGRT